MTVGTKELDLPLEKLYDGRAARNLKLLATAVFFGMFGFGALTAAYSNYAVQALHLSPKLIGMVESTREVPGLIMFVVAALTMRLAEPLLASLSLSLVAVGVAAYAKVDSIITLIVFSFIWSLGLHSWMTLQPSITLSLSNAQNRGRRLGRISGISALGTLFGMAFVLAVGARIGYKSIFLVSGFSVLLGAAAAFFIDRSIGHTQKPRFVWKKRYRRYYLLTFLEGCRKQVFMTFAIFVLVRNYHTSLRWVAALMIVNNLVNFFLAPKVGKLIDRIGERKVLAFCYAALIPVFIGYATIHVRSVLFLMYFLDNLFFLGSIGLNTYLHRIADPEDVMPSIAMGVSMNHGAAVLVPVLGGYLWSAFDYPVTFWGGAVVVAISVITALRMDRPSRLDKQAQA